MDKLTNAEAIGAIKNNMPTKGTYTILTEALGMAIEALEKQLPKKPAPEEADGYMFFDCPVCKTSIQVENYCPNCGQKIDWSEEE